jgi:predicted GNAT superfamily acetyltransferase
MAAVVDDVRDRGVGTALKFDQRAWAHEHDIPLIGWTYDPLVRRNAWLNLVKLGALVHEYLPNFYGEMDDELNAGDESDRIFVWWQTARHEPGSPIEDVRDHELTVELPFDIVAVRTGDRQQAIEWRHRVRESLHPRLVEGWSVRGLTREGSYVLTPPGGNR